LAEAEPEDGHAGRDFVDIENREVSRPNLWQRADMRTDVQGLILRTKISKELTFGRGWT